MSEINRNMRKMFTEKQIEEIAKSVVPEGIIPKEIYTETYYTDISATKFKKGRIYLFVNISESFQSSIIIALCDNSDNNGATFLSCGYVCDKDNTEQSVFTIDISPENVLSFTDYNGIGIEMNNNDLISIYGL